MNKFLILIMSIVVLSSCKNNEKGQEQGEEIDITADFIYFEDAAVLKGNDFIYGVKLDAKAKELANMVEPVKNDEFDMVTVVIKGIVNQKNENDEGWEEVVTITEIVAINDKPSEADVKIQ